MTSKKNVDAPRKVAPKKGRHTDKDDPRKDVGLSYLDTIRVHILEPHKFEVLLQTYRHRKTSIFGTEEKEETRQT